MRTIGISNKLESTLCDIILVYFVNMWLIVDHVMVLFGLIGDLTFNLPISKLNYGVFRWTENVIKIYMPFPRPVSISFY